MILSQNLVGKDDNLNIEQIKGSNIVRVLTLASRTRLVGVLWATKWKELHEDNATNVEIYLTNLPEIVDNLRKKSFR